MNTALGITLWALVGFALVILAIVLLVGTGSHWGYVTGEAAWYAFVVTAIVTFILLVTGARV